MNIRDAISKEINTLPTDQLALLYEQINSIKKQKRLQKTERCRHSLEDVHRIVSSSNQQWADDIVKSRDERL
jgi:hypothetical protein